MSRVSGSLICDIGLTVRLSVSSVYTGVSAVSRNGLTKQLRMNFNETVGNCRPCGKKQPIRYLKIWIRIQIYDFFFTYVSYMKNSTILLLLALQNKRQA